MPGLNQLKKFTSDIKEIGDEVTIRAQRGEKPAVVPLPEGISEEDDSEDFVLGLPEQDSQAAEEPATDSADTDTPEIDLNAQDSGEGLPPDLDALLNGQPQSGDEVPDLSAFMDDVSTPEKTEEPAETPLEDLDLDALLQSAAAPEETPVEESVPEPEAAPIDFGDLDGLASFEEMGPVAEETPVVDESPVADEAPVSADNPESEVSSLDDGLGETGEIDEFAFDGNAIDLNEDIPEEIAEEDGSMPEPEPEAAEELSTFETPDFDAPAADAGAEELSTFETPDFDAPAADAGAEALSTFETPDFDAPAPQNDSVESMFSTDGLDSPLDTGTSSENAEDPLAGFEVPDFDLPSENSGDSGIIDASMDVPAEEFDMAGALEGMGDANNIDFGTPAGGEEFPVTEGPKALGDDDFILDENDFEIPGFSDTETAAFDKKGKPKVDVADFSKSTTGKPKNTLTEEEYATYRKNLSAYPLNLRLAIEDLIVKNEFTDDAVFEVIEKVLKKAPARQLATHLEKMLDISIDVPRDYERRSVAQYEAYKQSFQYQLKNRIIPGGIAATVLAVIGYLLFQAAVMFIYKPSMASMLYKQGYTLLENNEYPQSEVKFADAVRYKPVKKWFFRYAHGYRQHKQYERASQMYRNILGIFDHDKNGGLEWAEMELYERANYEQSEEIVRRQVLDYHINDSDGLLLLGDIFLEWGETEAPKYEKAREQYSNLIQLYGATDLFMSRMLRYFIRTDKLRNVLELKGRFYPREKSLGASDWVELSGYLLDKLYGPLSRSDEYLRAQIEDVRAMLEIAEKADTTIPATHYNMARYFNHNSNFEQSRRELKKALDCFDKLEYRNKKNIYREIDTCRLLGELYADTREYLKAQEVYTRGINLYQSENERTGFEGDSNTGHLYADMGDIEYFISGDMEAALKDYEQAVLNKNDTASLNFRIGAIHYNKQEYEKSLASFIKASETEDNDVNLLLALGNVLSIRGDNFAAQGYYSHLLSLLNKEKMRHLVLAPQADDDDNRLVEMFLKTNNNLGVTLYRIARQTGDSAKNAESLVRLSDSIRAWDALTRNPKTMVRLGGSNLALQNSKYITNSRSAYEPAIYTDIPKTLVDEKELQ